MQFGCVGCNVKPLDGSPDQDQGAAETEAVLGLVEPSRRAARMRQRDESALAVYPALSDNIAERNASPEAFDRERSDEEDHARPHERDLLLEPRRAQSDFG